MLNADAVMRWHSSACAKRKRRAVGPSARFTDALPRVSSCSVAVVCVEAFVNNRAYIWQCLCTWVYMCACPHACAHTCARDEV